MPNNTPTNYAVVVFNKDPNIPPISYPFVKSIYYIHKLLLKENYNYWYMNVYIRKTRVYIGRQYCDTHIVDKPFY
jgi:hypothetical protein